MPVHKPSAVRLTPRGRGAVATILIEGTIDHTSIPFSGINGRTLNELPVHRPSYGFWGTDHQEDVVLLKLEQEAFEIHCHGGMAAVERILQDLSECGVTIRRPDSRDSRPYSIPEEFDVCLQRATTQRTAHLLLKQSKLFPEELNKLEDLGREEKLKSIHEMLRWANFGVHLTSPWQVVLCGPPNVGKSSLINALVGYSRSVVYDQPGTTRDVVTVQTALEGWAIEFSDTAGLRDATESLESQGIEKAKQKIKNADLLIVVVDARETITEFENALLESHPNSLLVLNKVDLVEEHQFTQESMPVSALEGVGVNDLAKRIVRELVPEMPPEKQAFPVTERQVEVLHCLQERKQ